jgi:5-methylcytosine-specific restriction endonuclease McrA
MGRRSSSLRLSGNAAGGPRPSRKSAVRARAGARGGAHARAQQSAARPQTVAGVAMKHVMRRSALRDCGQRCVYCATRLDQHTATLEHVVPLAHGGAHDAGNLVVACGPCNRLKGDRLPFEFFARNPWAGANFVRYARSVHRALKRGARRAVSLAFARDQMAA